LGRAVVRPNFFASSNAGYPILTEMDIGFKIGKAAISL
jgi:hypothetical protein